MSKELVKEYDGDYSEFEKRDAEYSNYEQRDFDALFEAEMKRIEQLEKNNKNMVELSLVV